MHTVSVSATVTVLIQFTKLISSNTEHIIFAFGLPAQHHDHGNRCNRLRPVLIHFLIAWTESHLNGGVIVSSVV